MTPRSDLDARPERTDPADPAYADEFALLSVETPSGDQQAIRLRAAGTGVGAVVDLSVIGAQRLATLLDNAVITATARGLGGGASHTEWESGS